MYVPSAATVSGRLLFVLSVILSVGSACLAQSTPYLEKGNVETGVFGGLSYGADSWRAMGGVNVSAAVNRWLLPYGEFTYFPGIRRTTAQGQQFDIPFYDIHGGVHLRAPIAETGLVPYAAIGFGVIRSNLRTTRTISTATGPRTDSFVFQDTDPAVNFGGGLRYYTKYNFGLRFEAKAYRPLKGQFDQVFGKVLVGIFYQFR